MQVNSQNALSPVALLTTVEPCLPGHGGVEDALAGTELVGQRDKPRVDILINRGLMSCAAAEFLGLVYFLQF